MLFPQSGNERLRSTSAQSTDFLHEPRKPHEGKHNKPKKTANAASSQSQLVEDGLLIIATVQPRRHNDCDEEVHSDFDCDPERRTQGVSDRVHVHPPFFRSVREQQM